MKKVNYHHLELLIGQLNTVSGKEAWEFSEIDPDNEQAIREVLRRFAKPTFDRLTPESQDACKNSFRYFLTTGNAPFQDIIEQQQESPITSPSRPIDLFIWLWRELFPNEDFKLDDIHEWKEDNKENYSDLMYRVRDK